MSFQAKLVFIATVADFAFHKFFSILRDKVLFIKREEGLTGDHDVSSRWRLSKVTYEITN